MVRMEVSNHDPLHVPLQITTRRCSPSFPNLTGYWIIVSGVYQNPSVFAFNEVHGDEA